MPMAALKRIQAGVLEVAYEEAGDSGGKPVILLHGFPYDVRAYDNVAPRLAASGCRVLTPYLRGYGPTRFLSADTPRSGQQAVLAQDLLSFMDALAIPSATLAGYDWGGRAACIVAALWPDRADALVTGNGYNLQNIPRALEPSSRSRTVRSSASCSGISGRQTGSSTTQPTRAPPHPSITRTSSTWWCIPTATATGWCPAIRRWKPSRNS
jgi:pimeloyl-ACP methyl ester carboxylesterase